MENQIPRDARASLSADPEIPKTPLRELRGFLLPVTVSCRSEPARGGVGWPAFFQEARIIVNIHREQACYLFGITLIANQSPRPWHFRRVDSVLSGEPG